MLWTTPLSCLVSSQIWHCRRPCVSAAGRSLQTYSPACETRTGRNDGSPARHTCFCDVDSRHKVVLDEDAAERQSVAVASRRAETRCCPSIVAWVATRQLYRGNRVWEPVDERPQQ